MTDSTSPVVDLDLRLVGYFVVVAEHRHFGRAASALRVAQPSLSRQIRQLERQLGVQLLDRTPQGTRLTEAGEVFLPRAKALLRSAAQATAQARAAAQPSRITVGYTTGLIVTRRYASCAASTWMPTCKPCTWNGTKRVMRCSTIG